MGDEKKKAVASIKPKRVKARRRPDGTLEILEEVKSEDSAKSVGERAEDQLDSFSFSDREALKEELLKEQRGGGTYGPDGKLDLFDDSE